MAGVDVVVTGIGLVTPIGDNIDTFWENVSKGKTSGFRVDKDYPDSARFIQFALDAASRAVRDSGLSQDMLKRAGVTISSSKGGIFSVRGFASHSPHMAGIRCAEHFGCRGPCINVISACATGLSSIIIGVNLIKTNRARIVLAGGTDACLTDFVFAAYKRMGVLAEGHCLPYDKRRKGFTLSEGAGVVVLEEKGYALKRKAGIYGEISGYASLCEGYHMTSLDPGAETIMKAIKLSSKNPDYINTHGTGTIENDIIETRAIKEAFGKRAYAIPLSSTKAVTGHMLGASGAVEFIVGLLAMKNDFVPPTMNLEQPDPICDLDYTPLAGKMHSINRFLTLSYGFGGHVCAAEVKKL